MTKICFNCKQEYETHNKDDLMNMCSDCLKTFVDKAIDS